MGLATLKSWIATAEGIKMSESNRRFKNGMPPVHPGEILVDEIVELDMSVSEFATALAAPKCQVKAILQCDEGITAEMALRLSRYFGTTAELWMNLQSTYDLKVTELSIGVEIENQVMPRVDTFEEIR
jgi:addiction module HigA family antidote